MPYQGKSHKHARTRGEIQEIKQACPNCGSHRAWPHRGNSPAYNLKCSRCGRVLK